MKNSSGLVCIYGRYNHINSNIRKCIDIILILMHIIIMLLLKCMLTLILWKVNLKNCLHIHLCLDNLIGGCKHINLNLSKDKFIFGPYIFQNNQSLMKKINSFHRLRANPVYHHLKHLILCIYALIKMFAMCLNKLLTKLIKELEQLHHQRCIWCSWSRRRGSSCVSSNTRKRRKRGVLIRRSGGFTRNLSHGL
jgi:hypothetical protein